MERIIRLKQDKAQAHEALKRTIDELAQRMSDRGVSEAQIGEHFIVVSPKLLTDYDQNTLGSLKNCVTQEQIWVTFKQLPSGKQLKALSDLAGASAKAVIQSARRKNETDVVTIKMKKPRKHKNGEHAID